MSYKLNESEILKNLFESSDDLKDAVFTFPDHSGRIIRAHKNILASTSPVFHAMFYGSLKEQGTVEICDLHPDIFQRLINCLYGQKLTFNGIEDAESFYAAADRFNIPTDQIIEYLKTQITYDDCIGIYEFARQFGLNNLDKMCVTVFERSTERVMLSDKFLEALPDTINTIFSLGEIRGLDELRMCKYLDLWLFAQDGDFYENVQSVKPAIHSIRFLSVKKLKRCDLKTVTFLTGSQKETIFKMKRANISSVHDLPEFSLNKFSRSTTDPNIRCERCKDFFTLEKMLCQCKIEVNRTPKFDKLLTRYKIRGIPTAVGHPNRYWC